MLTVIETPTFQKQVVKVWSQEERHDFINWIAANPDAGDVIPGGNGMRKVRWTVAGKGKRGGVLGSWRARPAVGLHKGRSGKHAAIRSEEEMNHENHQEL